MTVSTTTTKVIYNGDGATTAFPTTFEFFDAADIEVIERVITTGAETVKTLTTDYTVSGGAGATGTVAAVTAPPATVQWVIRRVTPLTQLIDYVENDDFPAETHEKGLDLAVMRAQERKEELDRAAKFPVSDPASSIGEIPNSVVRANLFLGFDAAGKPVAQTVTGETVTAFIKTLLDDADAATARATLGAGTGSLDDLVDDTTPQLGGVLDTNARAIDESEGAAVASAATTDIWASDGNTVHVTGTVTITSFGTAPRVGAWRKVIFDGILTLTDGANLNLPGGANITTAADDFAFVYAETTTLFKVLYFKADGTAVVGSGSFTEEFISADQTITAAGALTLAHSLSAAPKLVQVWLKCTTAQHNYAVNDEVELGAMGQAIGSNSGASIVPDGTNLNIRYGSAAGTFSVLDKTTGANAAITNTSWRAIFKAWV